MLIHRYPIGDIYAHFGSLECPCNPSLYEGDGEDMAWHHSFDRREIIIGVEIMLGYRNADGNCIDKDGNECDLPPRYYEYPKDQHDGKYRQNH